MESQASALSLLAQEVSNHSLNASVASFDTGRLQLAAICILGVAVAVATSWLWVGNNILRRLSRLSSRMRTMSTGDFETPVRGVSGDEIGQLAGSLEVFRQQALEVQRLNLVESLYGELTTAYTQLGEMQQRLVAQEKLAALGQLVSGVAHEISNPLNFVKNFTEGCRELSDELFEVLDEHKDEMSESDLETVEDIRTELGDGLGRILMNGGRALAIVQRMQAFGVSNTQASPMELNSAITQSVDAGLSISLEEFPEFIIAPEYELSADVGDVVAVAGDVREIVVNLVTNACYSMYLRSGYDEEGYAPVIQVSTEMKDDHVEIVVGDNGTGIKSEIKDRIFDPFFTTRDGALGAGLGLTLAADLARRGGGDISCETESWEGARFYVTIPLTPVEEEVVTVVVPMEEEMAAVRGIGQGS